MVKILKSVFWVLFLTLILLGFPKLAGTIANAFDYGVIDPDGVFAWLFVHHIAQTVLFIALIMIIRLYRPINFHLGWGDVKFGRRYVLRFTSYFIRYLIGFFVFSFLTNSVQLFTYPMTARNIIGYLSFQLLLTGPSEELIFRAFAISMLSLVVKGRVIRYGSCLHYGK